MDREVYEIIGTGEVIEKYLTDKPYPSLLIFVTTNTGRPLHAVCLYNENEKVAIVITVYHPRPDLWIDYKGRKS